MPSDLIAELRKPKTLLLVGGVFGFVLLIAWFAFSFRIVSEPDPRALGAAIGAVTFYDDSPAARTAAAAVYAAASSTSAAPLAPDAFTTLYAALDENGRLGLHSLTAPPNGSCSACRIRLLARDVVATGFIRSPSDGSPIPLEIRLDGKLIAARLGRGFRGVSFPEGGSLKPYRGLTAVPDQALMYYADQDFSRTSSALMKLRALNQETLPPELSALLNGIGRRFELIYGSHPGDLLQPFVIHAAASGSATSTSLIAIEADARNLVGALAPYRDTYALPDKSLSFETRSSVKDVLSETRRFLWGTIKTFTDPSKRLVLTLFEDTSGEVWISDHAELLQQIILANAQSVIPMRQDCLPTDADAGAILYPHQIPPYLSSFKLISILLKDRETGLLTFCGYLK